ncbi:hypothetical protein DPMN_016007 [Dreissena polymorpha]|uniref:Uncharacterized protein n=1 Tax=Dreissena polymorpha TaxID=45954 RepID=A0A9D4NER4_DREPO|nr:hypothetical protein DPMN_016007 [Dreissena polymorpha]
MLAESTTVSDTFGTIVTFEVVHDTTGVALTNVNVGQTVKLKVSIPQSDNGTFNFAPEKLD